MYTLVILFTIFAPPGAVGKDRVYQTHAVTVGSYQTMAACAAGAASISPQGNNPQTVSPPFAFCVKVN